MLDKGTRSDPKLKEYRKMKIARLEVDSEASSCSDSESHSNGEETGEEDS